MLRPYSKLIRQECGGFNVARERGARAQRSKTSTTSESVSYTYAPTMRL